MLSEVKERLEGLKYHLDFVERGWWNTGERDRYIFTMEKGSFYRSASTLLSLIVAPLLSERKEENMREPKRAYKYCILRVLQTFICLYIS